MLLHGKQVKDGERLSWRVTAIFSRRPTSSEQCHALRHCWLAGAADKPERKRESRAKQHAWSIHKQWPDKCAMARCAGVCWTHCILYTWKGICWNIRAKFNSTSTPIAFSDFSVRPFSFGRRLSPAPSPAFPLSSSQSHFSRIRVRVSACVFALALGITAQCKQ